jgi:hypothetical protein
LVRLIVSGQLALEETLSRPQCDAFNQRIACQVMLPSLTRDESSSYLTRRLAWAGANVSEVFVRDALTAICEAADGVPRCLHQLADHCLTLAARRGEKPITLRIVREALEHLKQLPLTWAEPTVGRGAINVLEAARAQVARGAETSHAASGQSVRGFEPGTREVIDDIYETYPLQAERSEGTDERASSRLDEAGTRRFDDGETQRDTYTGIIDSEIESPDFVQPVETTVSSRLEFDGSTEAGTTIALELNQNVQEQCEETAPQRLVNVSQGTAATVVDEEVVTDRYAALDSALNRLTRTMINVQATARKKAEGNALTIWTKASIPVEAIDAFHQRFDVVLPEEVSADVDSRANSDAKSVNLPRALPAKEAAADILTDSLREPVIVREPIGAVSVVAAPVATTSSPSREATERTTTDERRPYQLLFSELRRRRRRV